MDEIEDEYQKAFVLKGKKYRKVEHFDKPRVGISLVIDHDKKLMQKLKLGDKKYVCTIAIYLDDEWREAKGNKKNIFGRVHFTIDSDTGAYVLLNPEKYSARIPVEITSVDEYFFNTKTKKFYRGSRETSLRSIVDELFEWHIKPTKLFRGMFLRWKIQLRRLLYKFSLRISKFIAYIYYFIFGEKVAHDFVSEYMLKHYPEKKEIKTARVNEISIFGYTSSAHIVFVFCIFHLISRVNSPLSESDATCKTR